eukprot:gene5384-6057_t
MAKDAVDGQVKENENLKKEMTRFARQLMLQQFFTEERVRSEGSSGLKHTRIRTIGEKNYFSEHHSGSSMAAIHDHANNIRTVGMGEFVGVLNGVEFRTRHNDYRLYMPHRTSKEYHEQENVPFPDVPPAVKQQTDVDSQIKEMREWFKAWRDQDHSVRDYRKFFKPLLCYLEGAWTRPGKSVDEPFHSDRHFVDAKTWFDLQEKFRFNSYSGSKSILENIPFLPTTIMRFVNETIPVFAQWNYRISCHPLKQDVPFSKLKPVDDLATRMRNRRSFHQHLHSRSARFTLDGSDRQTTRTFLDDLMEEIPGKDNYQANLTDIGFNAEGIAMDIKTGKIKNVGYYHRSYKVAGKDAMGLSYINRGFSDSYMYSAMTTQKRIAGVEIPNPKKCKGSWKNRVCETLHQKWSWAIPLELIYLTPLQKWNPYNIQYKGEARSAEGKTVNANRRYGSCGKNDDTSFALNGTNSKYYFRTPSAFFLAGKEGNTDAADTSKKYGACVLTDAAGKKQVRMMASGVRVFLPNIPGVGVMRTRYPIMPVHGEGSPVWKELNALKEIVMDPKKHARMFWDGGAQTSNESEWQMQDSQRGTLHTHTIMLTPSEMSQLKGGRELQVVTNMANGHQHELKIRWNTTKKVIFYSYCGSARMCRDRHPRDLIPLNVDSISVEKMSGGSDSADGTTTVMEEKLWFPLTSPNEIKQSITPTVESISVEQEDMVELKRKNISSELKSSLNSSPEITAYEKSLNITKDEELALPKENVERWYEVAAINLEPSGDKGIETVAYTEYEEEYESLAEGSEILSDRSTNSNNSSVNSPSVHSNAVKERANSITVMQRPEPLGKARAENETKKIKDNVINKSSIVQSSGIKANEKEDATVVENLEESNKINVMSENDIGQDGFLKESKANHLDDSDIENGLKEQAYPVRIPLSLYEGYNHLSGESLYSQPRGSERRGDDHNIDHDILHNPGVIDRADNNSGMDAFATRADGMDKSLFSENSEPQLTFQQADQNEGKLVNQDDPAKESRPDPFPIVSNVDPATPISKLLGPTYKSSVVLLEELKRRRLKNADIRGEILNDPARKTNRKHVNSGTKSHHDITEPMKLAENAMKASKILSNRTEKSLKRATEVLDAVREQRTPPYNESESFSPITFYGDSLAAKLRELSISSLTIGGSMASNTSTDNGSDEKDSIDKIIEARLRYSEHGPSPFSSQNSGEENSIVLLDSNVIGLSSDSTSSSLNFLRRNSDQVDRSDQATLKKDITQFQTESSLVDVTSSELLKLKSFGNETESPYYDKSMSKAIAANLLNDISPIEQQRETKPTSRQMGFRSSSRKNKNDNSNHVLRHKKLSDSEIVRLHRSLGAGTVTPLPHLDSSATERTKRNEKEDAGVLIPPSFSSVEEPSRLHTHTSNANSRSTDNASIASSSEHSQRLDEKISTDFSEDSAVSSLQQTELSPPGESREEADNRGTDGSFNTALNANLSWQKESYQNIRGNEGKGPVRGIYDVRDSSGPGSTNRKRRILGKDPLERKDRATDPFTVYVSEQSRSSFASSRSAEKREKNELASSQGYPNADKDKEPLMVHGSNAKDATKSSFSSMSSQSPYLSYFGDEYSEHGPSENELEAIHGHEQDTKVKEDNGNVLMSANGQSERSNEIRAKPSVKMAWRVDAAIPYKQSQPSDFNSLWQRFQQRFEPGAKPRKGDVFEKIGVLSEILNDQIGSTPRPLSGEMRKAEDRGAKRTAKADREFVMRKSTRTRDGVETIPASVEVVCCNCKKREVGTNCPTPVPFESEENGSAEMPQPLLLHTWTQTTPSNAMPQKEEHFARRVPPTKHTSPVNTRTTGAADKENAQNSANTVRSGQSGDKPLSSWSVTFEQKKQANELKSKPSAAKPPIHPISKAQLQEGEQKKKRKDPIFTAWFQSTRSDTSSGTVVPLSEVPKLASSFKGRAAPKIYIEEVKPKETESIVRVGLQEAFKFAKEDFIRRSQQRVDQVKTARFQSEKRKNLKNLKERHIEEAVFKNEPTSQPRKIDHLFKAKKRQINKKEMREQNKRMYDKLPEVVKKREEDKRKAQYAGNRMRLKQFDKHSSVVFHLEGLELVHTLTLHY